MIRRFSAAGLFLVLAVVALTTTAHAEVPPPLKQLVAGVSPEDVLCREGLALVVRGADDAVCVREETAEKIGWIVTIPDAGTAESTRLLLQAGGLVPAEISDYSGIVAANNGFAVDFYSHAAGQEGKNIVFSPWSIYSAFALTHEGAEGDTRDELTDAFGFPEEKRMQFGPAMVDLNRPDAEYRLSVANALWLAEWLEPLEEYVQTARVYYDSGVERVDFGSGDAVRTINGWVSDNTGGKIDEVLAPGSVGPATALVITNAVYFKGEWVNTFDESRTIEDDSFWITPDKKVAVPMMYGEEYYRHADVGTHQVLEMPYVGDRISMLVLLPNEKGRIGELEGLLSAESLEEWRGDLVGRKLEVYFPKFSLDISYDLIENMSAMGVTSLFGGTADLSGIAGEDVQLYVSKAIHKAFINVNEKGTEAGATTAIVDVTSWSQPFIADHPFVFVIQDTETGNILFIGRLSDPS